MFSRPRKKESVTGRLRLIEEDLKKRRKKKVNHKDVIEYELCSSEDFEEIIEEPFKNSPAHSFLIHNYCDLIFNYDFPLNILLFSPKKFKDRFFVDNEVLKEIKGRADTTILTLLSQGIDVTINDSLNEEDVLRYKHLCNLYSLLVYSQYQGKEHSSCGQLSITFQEGESFLYDLTKVIVEFAQLAHDVLEFVMQETVLINQHKENLFNICLIMPCPSANLKKIMKNGEVEIIESYINYDIGLLISKDERLEMLNKIKDSMEFVGEFVESELVKHALEVSYEYWKEFGRIDTVDERSSLVQQS